MATRRQIEANRRNAQKSTGPRTPEGKQKSRWNALRHGLASVHTVLPHEDPSEYHRIRAELIQTWQPVNAQELMLVDQVAGGYWRMQRSRRFETALFDQHVQTLKSKHGFDTAPCSNDDDAIVVSMCDDDNETGYSLWFRYDARAQSTYFRALAHLRQLHNDRVRRERLANPNRSRVDSVVAACAGSASAPISTAESTELASFSTPQMHTAVSAPADPDPEATSSAASSTTGAHAPVAPTCATPLSSRPPPRIPPPPLIFASRSAAAPPPPAALKLLEI